MKSATQARLSVLTPHDWALAGELTQHSVPGCYQGMQARPINGDLRIDLQGLERIDSCALALLIQLARRVRGQGGQLIINNAPAGLVSLAGLSGVTDLLGLPAA